MFKNKIKYSLLAGSLYNVKCDYTFNVYINGKKTSISKTIKLGTLFDIGGGLGSFDFEGNKFDSYEKYKKENPTTQTFDNYLQCVLFYKEIDDELKDCLYACEMKHSTEGMVLYTTEFDDKQILKYDDIEDCGSGNIKINVYYVKKAEYKILNETEVLSDDFINSLKRYYIDKTAKESVRICLEKIKSTNYCLTYKQLLKKLDLFDVYINNEQIKNDDKKYITPEEAKKLFLLPKPEFQKKKTINLYFNNDDHIRYQSMTIPSYVTLNYIKESFKYNDIWNNETCYNIYKHEGLEFYNDSAFNNKIGDKDIIKGDIYVKVKQYFVATFKDTVFKDFLCNGEYVDVDNLDDYINKYKTNNKLIGKKHSIFAVVQNNLIKGESFKDVLTNHICVFVNSKINETKEEHIEKPKEELKPTEELKNEEILIETHKEGPKEEHIEEIKEEILTDEKPTETNPTGETPTGDKDDKGVVKKTALINECNKLVNKIKALDSSYDKTINGSDSVEKLESLKTELTNKLNELKNKKKEGKYRKCGKCGNKNNN